MRASPLGHVSKKKTWQKKAGDSKPGVWSWAGVLQREARELGLTAEKLWGFIT